MYHLQKAIKSLKPVSLTQQEEKFIYKKDEEVKCQPNIQFQHQNYCLLLGKKKNEFPESIFSSYDISDPNAEALLENISPLGYGAFNERRKKLRIFQDRVHSTRFKEFSYQDLRNAINLAILQNSQKTGYPQSPISYYESIVRQKQLHKLFSDSIDETERLHLSLITNFYTGSYSDRISRGASIELRMANTMIPSDQAEQQLTKSAPLFHYLARALSFLPCYYGTVTRSIKVKESKAIYKPGNLICWLQFSSSAQGLEPPSFFSDRKTWFHIHSLSGRSIKKFSNHQKENQVLFLPCTTFLVLKTQTRSGIYHVYMRQVELGISQNNVMWVDDKIFDKDYENKKLMETSIIQGRKKKIRFILKDSTELAMSYFRSELGKLYLKTNRTNFRLISDMRRGLDHEAGAILLSKLVLHNLNKLNFGCMIYTSDRVKAIDKLKKHLCEQLVKNIKVSVIPMDVLKFLDFK